MTPNRVPGAGGVRVAPSSVRQARIARVNMIRRRAVSGALALFVATWLLITLMLVSGHDPALARQRPSTSVSTAATAPSSTTTGATSTTTPTTTTTTTPATSSSTSSSATSGPGSSGVSAVTSSQS
jgi:hypothetical protein